MMIRVDAHRRRAIAKKASRSWHGAWFVGWSVWMAGGAVTEAGDPLWVSARSDGLQADGQSSFPAISGDGRFVAFMSAASNLVEGDTNGALDVFVHDRATFQTERVSVGSTGEQGDADSAGSGLCLSDDGRFVAFWSQASNLVPGDTNDAVDVFIHDRQTGQTTRVSVDSAGLQADGGSLRPSLDGAGRYVAFESSATNLVPGDTNNRGDIFVHDRQTGQTHRVSVNSQGVQGDSHSYTCAMARNGRVVAFASESSNFAPGDTLGQARIYVHELDDGTTLRISSAFNGGRPNGNSFSPCVSADGNHVAFRSRASDLIPNDANDNYDVFVYNRLTQSTFLVSKSSFSAQGNFSSDTPSISADGRYVAFQSYARNLVEDSNRWGQIYLHDRDFDGDGVFDEAISVSTVRASDDYKGKPASSDCFTEGEFALSADGRYVVYATSAENQARGDANGYRDVFVTDATPGGGVGCRDVKKFRAKCGGQAMTFKLVLTSDDFDGSVVTFQVDDQPHETDVNGGKAKLTVEVDPGDHVARLADPPFCERPQTVHCD